MKWAITDGVHLRKTIDPADNTGKVQVIDLSNDFEDICKKMNKLQKRLKIGVTDLLRYLLAMLPLAYQGMIYAVRTKNVLADSTYKGLWILEFNDKLPANQYMNWNIFHIFLSIKIKSSTNEANDVATNMVIVNNFFLPIGWKKIGTKRYRDDLWTLPTNNPTEIYWYSDSILKRMSKGALKTLKKTLLYSK